MRRAERVRVFVGEDERWRGRPLFEAIVLAARDRGLAGATVFRGFMGYSPHADVATAGILRLAENLPVVVDMVDDADRIGALLPFLGRAVRTGMVLRAGVFAEQVLPGRPQGRPGGTDGMPPDLAPTVRARAYLRDGAALTGTPAHASVARAFEGTGAKDVSVHHGIMGFDRSSGVISVRPLRFHADLPVVVEAVGDREEIGTALPRVREVVQRGLITLSGVESYGPEPSLPPGASAPRGPA